MKFLFTALLLLCYSPFLFSQNIDIEQAADHAGNSVTTFPAGDGTVTVAGNQFVLGSVQIVNPLAWSFSESGNRAAFLLNRGGVELTSYNAEGRVLINKMLEFFEPSDNTVEAYQFENGRIILRDNVANFSFLNPRGEVAYTQSNSSGSTGGEQESKLAADPSGNTVVLYNPVIAYNVQTGSRAQLVYGARNASEFFRSRSEEIKQVRISDDGSFITLITDAGSDDNVSIFDRFGNEIFHITTDENLIGATLHHTGSFITLYSSGRAQVYEIPGGERLGSASSRTSLLYADYDPGSETIIALGGTLESRRIREPEIMAVSISRREIAREEIPFDLSVLDLSRLDISSSGPQIYDISGLNRPLRVSVQF